MMELIAPKMKHMAYCGFDCGTCPIFTSTESNNGALKDELARRYSNADKHFERDEIGCGGCKSDLTAVHPFCGECVYRLCARKRGIESCGECVDYPCMEITSNSALSKSSIDTLDAIHKHRFG